MEKGWGLTLGNSDPVSSFFHNKTNSTAGPVFRLKQHPDMLQFPVSLAGSREDRPGTSSSSSPASDDNRVAVDEVDFFSNKKHGVVDEKKTGTVIVKTETTSHGGDGPSSDHLDVNVSVLFFILLLKNRKKQLIYS